MMTLARLAVLLAAVTTLWFNGSYAYSKADSIAQQAGFVAMAIAIDLVKATFLVAAAYAWAERSYWRAIICVVIWLPALAFSTFAGYAAITTNRHGTAAVVDARAAERARVQSAYDRDLAALTTAQSSPIFKTTAACTSTTTNAQRQTCTEIRRLQQSVDALSKQLGPSPAVQADPDQHALASLFAVAPKTIAFWVAFLPALLLELVASLGAYAVAPRHRVKASEASSGRVFPLEVHSPTASAPKASTPRLSASDAAASPASQSTASPPRLPRLPRTP